jgi:hypothetical protein
MAPTSLQVLVPLRKQLSLREPGWSRGQKVGISFSLHFSFSFEQRSMHGERFTVLCFLTALSVLLPSSPFPTSSLIRVRLLRFESFQ